MHILELTSIKLKETMKEKEHILYLESQIMLSQIFKIQSQLIYIKYIYKSI